MDDKTKHDILKRWILLQSAQKKIEWKVRNGQQVGRRDRDRCLSASRELGSAVMNAMPQIIELLKEMPDSES